MSFNPYLFIWRWEVPHLIGPQFCRSGQETFDIHHTAWHTPALNKFHCLLSQPLHQCFWALMEKITQWFRSIPIYGLHIHWALTTAWQTLCVSVVTLSPTLKLAISNILPPPQTFYLVSWFVILITGLFFPSRAFRSSLLLNCPSPKPGWPHMCPVPQMFGFLRELCPHSQGLALLFAASLFCLWPPSH